MNLLITTQKVDQNDDVLGFFHSWIEEFAKHFEKITVICLFAGKYDLPENVEVLSLGKELRITNNEYRISKLFRRLGHLAKFYKYVWQKRKDYDSVFVHMNSEYVVLGGWFWKIMKKKIGLWYVHKAIPWQLRVAERLADVIFTASKESCNLSSEKIEVVGHGIDLGKFQIPNFKFQIKPKSQIQNSKQTLDKEQEFNIIYVGRISPIKNQELLIQAIDLINQDKTITNLKVQLIGGTVYEKDKEYLGKLKKLASDKKLESIIEFVGPVSSEKVIDFYKNADLAVNLCPTGGVDKAVLEAMACGIPVVVENKTFIEFAENNPGLIMLQENSQEFLADKIKKIYSYSINTRERGRIQSRQIVEDNFSLRILVANIKKIIKTRI